MPYVDYKRIRGLVTLEQALEEYGWELSVEWRNGTLRGQCPLCRKEHRTLPFQVQPDRRIFRCFKCGAMGDVVGLWAMLHGLTQYEASLDLCRTFDICPPVRED